MRIERPTCGECHHFIRNADPEQPGKRDEGTCHVRSPDRGGIHQTGSHKYSDAWPAVLDSDVACGSEFSPREYTRYFQWRKIDGRWEYTDLEGNGTGPIILDPAGSQDSQDGQGSPESGHEG